MLKYQLVLIVQQDEIVKTQFHINLLVTRKILFVSNNFKT